MKSFYSQLCKLNTLSNRFELCRQEPIESVNDNAEEFTSADAKILFCNYNPQKMDNDYELFMFKVREPLSQEELSFIENYRINKLGNDLIEGFYADVYCNGQSTPNSKYVELVIQKYISFWENSHVTDFNEAENILRSLIYNSQRYRKDKEPIKGIIKNYVSSDVELWEKRKILIDTYNYGFLKAKELRKLIYDYNLNQGLGHDYFQNKVFFTMLLNIADKTIEEQVKQTYWWLAENENAIVKMHPNDVMSANYALAKMEFLNKGGFVEEAKEANKQFLWLKENGKGMTTFSQKISIPDWVFRPQIDLICNSESPIKTIAEDNFLLPSYDWCEIDPLKELKQLGISIYYSDINGNPHPKEEYDKSPKDTGFNQHYFFTFYIPMLKSLNFLINNGFFSVEAINSYLSNSWIGKPRVAVNSQLKKTRESWLPMIMPSVEQIVEEIKKELQSNGSYNGNFVCAIDSLTMKIEGCIRDVCRRLNIQTVKENHDEIPLELLLERMEVFCDGNETSIDGKTLRMLRAVLTKKAHNQRNIIAHGLTSASDYNMQTAISTLHCLLRLCTISVPE